MTPFQPEKLSKLIGPGNVPTLIDIRIDVDVAADPLDSGGDATRAFRRSGLGFLPNGAIRRTEVERANHRVASPQQCGGRGFRSGQRG
jgi:hypothetical protein